MKACPLSDFTDEQWAPKEKSIMIPGYEPIFTPSHNEGDVELEELPEAVVAITAAENAHQRHARSPITYSK